MAQQHHVTETIDSGLHRFERNRFFHGKLMTARDMEAEQDYHRSRLRTVLQHVAGEGVVCGLATTVEETEDASLEVTVEPGLALDARGRPIVVGTATTEEFDLTEVSDPTTLYIEYDDCVRETVPVPGSEDACQEECTYNRVLEIFEISHQPATAAADHKPVPPIEFPERSDFDDPENIPGSDDTLRQIAESYNEDADGETRPCATSDDRAVYLGTFESGPNGEWQPVSDAESRAHVYTNDLLYAAIARHTADFENPHEVSAEQAGALVSVEGVSNPGGNVDLRSSDNSITVAADAADPAIDLQVADDLHEQVADLRDRMSALEDRLGRADRQLMRSTLHHKRLVFALVADRFGVDAANEASEVARDALEDGVYEDLDAYIEFTEAMLEIEQTVAEELADLGRQTGLAQYEQAVEELAAVVENTTGTQPLDRLHRLARAQALIAETAEWIGHRAVEEPRVNPRFASSTVTVEEGDTGDIEVIRGDADALELQLGDDASGYVLTAGVDPGALDRVTLRFDTAQAGEDGQSLTAAENIEVTVLDETSLDGPLAVGEYPLALRVPGREDGPVDVGTLVVERGEETIPVPDVLGREVPRARATIEEAGLDPDLNIVSPSNLQDSRRIVEEFGFDVVFDQDPAPGTDVPEGTTVELSVLTAVSIPELPDDIIRDIPLETIRPLPDETIVELPEDVIRELPDEDLVGISDPLVPRLPDDVVGGFPDERIASLSDDVLVELDEDRLAGVSEETIRAVDNETLLAVDNETLREVDTEVINAVDTQTLNEVNNETLNAVDVATLNEVDNETLNAVDDTTLREVDNETLNAVDVATLNEVDNETLNAVDNQTLTEVNNDTLNAVDNTTLNEVDNETLNAVDDTTLNEVDNETLNAVDNQTLNEVNNDTLNAVDNTTLNEVDNETLNAVDNTTLNELDNDTLIEHDPDRLRDLDDELT